MNVKDNIIAIQKAIPNNVTLVAVSKTMSEELIMDAYNTGQRIFGENYVQELVDKQTNLPKDIQWHMIGHLQTNKVKQIASFVEFIQSVDSEKLIEEIQKQAKNKNRIINCLIEFSIAEDGSKFGFSEEEFTDFLIRNDISKYPNIRFCGVMGMGSFSDDKEISRREFRNLKTIFSNIKSRFFAEDDNFNKISMGMSNDYEIAIEEGSNVIRVGSKIFGKRIYTNKI